jgi:hypothetical protein
VAGVTILTSAMALLAWDLMRVWNAPVQEPALE